MDSVSQLLSHLEEARQARKEDYVRLLDDVEGIRRDRQRECVRLLQELTPHLYAARAVDRELNRHLAHRFNVFRYLRDDELGLSRIIADLLDPEDEHGQGATYLKAMLELLEVSLEAPDLGRIRVVTERGFEGRFIDITVDIPTDAGRFCLAFENKPYAGDQYRQCIEYLKSLQTEYGERFLLVYLPPRFRMPEELSLPLEDYRRDWTNHFRVLPYVADDGSRGDEGPSDDDSGALARANSGAGHAPTEDDAPSAGSGDVPGFPAPGEDNVLAEDGATYEEAAVAHADAVVGDGASLADWFGACCKLSDAERLRWFLREAQLYCREHFGDSIMTDTEARYVREYLYQNPRHLHAAFAVARAWPALHDDVCRRFLEHLRERVEKRVRNEFPNMADDLNVTRKYRGKKKWWSDYLCVYRSRWVRRKPALDLGSHGRMAVVMTCDGGPKAWHWGVTYGTARNDKMPRQDRRRCEELEMALKRRGLSLPEGGGEHWPQFQWSPRYQDWTAIVPELARELSAGGGKITDYYVNGLLGVAKKAIPAIDEVELANQSPSASEDS